MIGGHTPLKPSTFLNIFTNKTAAYFVITIMTHLLSHKHPTNLSHKCPTHLSHEYSTKLVINVPPIISHKCPIPISPLCLTSHFMCAQIVYMVNIDVPASVGGLVLPHSTHNLEQVDPRPLGVRGNQRLLNPFLKSTTEHQNSSFCLFKRGTKSDFTGSIISLGQRSNQGGETRSRFHGHLPCSKKWTEGVT